MSAPTVQEPLRDRIGRVIYEQPELGGLKTGSLDYAKHLDWYSLSESRREPWRLDADRVIALIDQDTSAIRRIVDEQAEDEGLWFVAQTAPEAYLQQELRKLHAAIEAVIKPA